MSRTPDVNEVILGGGPLVFAAPYSASSELSPVLGEPSFARQLTGTLLSTCGRGNVMGSALWVRTFCFHAGHVSTTLVVSSITFLMSFSLMLLFHSGLAIAQAS